MNSKNENPGKTPTIAGWLARIFNAKEATMQRLVTLMAILLIGMTWAAIWKEWKSASPVKAPADQVRAPAAAGQD